MKIEDKSMCMYLYALVLVVHAHAHRIIFSTLTLLKAHGKRGERAYTHRIRTGWEKRETKSPQREIMCLSQYTCTQGDSNG